MDPVSVARNDGTTPTTGLLCASTRVIVTVDVAVPLATTGPVPVIVELAATAAPALNVTLVEREERDEGDAMETVLTPETVVLIVAVVIPEALVLDEGPARVLPLPEADKATV